MSCNRTTINLGPDKLLKLLVYVQQTRLAAQASPALARMRKSMTVAFETLPKKTGYAPYMLQLDALRAFAVVAVIYHHFTPRWVGTGCDVGRKALFQHQRISNYRHSSQGEAKCGGRGLY
jgi:hypothetical protein